MNRALVGKTCQRLDAGGRLLVTRLRYVGDAVLTLPLLAALRSAFAAAEIHYLAEPAALEVLREQAEIDVFWRAPRGAASTLELGRRLRAQHFAAAIDLFCNPRSALLVYLSGAPLRIGEARRARRHLYTQARRLVPGRSALEQHLDALRGLGLEPPPPSRPVLRLGAGERAAGAACLHSYAVGGPRLVLHLAASQTDKEWPAEPAEELVRRLAAGGVRVLLSSAPSRPEPSAQLATRVGEAATLLPPMPLRALLGVLAAADLVVSVDGALVHAAVALGRPTLALFGRTDPRVWFPYPEFGPYRVLRAAPGGAQQAPRGRAPEVGARDLRGLDAAAVERQVWELLEAANCASPNPGHE